MAQHFIDYLLLLGPAFRPDFREAAMIQATVDTILCSARERRWVAVDEVLPQGFVSA